MLDLEPGYISHLTDQLLDPPYLSKSLQHKLRRERPCSIHHLLLMGRLRSLKQLELLAGLLLMR